MKTIQVGKATLIHGDCEEFMKDIPDKSFDLAVVDPQYGIGAGSIKFKNGTSKGSKEYYKINDWDSKRPNKNYFDDLLRVSKNAVIWGGNYFSDLLPPFRCFLSWDKTIHGNSYADCELAWTSFDSVARYYRENISQVTSEGRIHPTQKSVKLYEWILKNYAKPGQTILDTHGGSMSSVIAALNMGFEITCIEKDEDYFNAAVERVIKSQQQQRMFE